MLITFFIDKSFLCIYNIIAILVWEVTDMVFEKLRDIIVEQLGVSAEDVTMESSIENDLGADSLDLVEIVMAIEEEFDFEVSEDDVEGIDTIGKAVEYIKSHAE